MSVPGRTTPSTQMATAFQMLVTSVLERAQRTEMGMGSATRMTSVLASMMLMISMEMVYPMPAILVLQMPRTTAT